jgi:hypothetical protein
MSRRFLLLAILVAALIASRCTGVILPIGIIKRNTLLAMSVALMLSPPQSVPEYASSFSRSWFTLESKRQKVLLGGCLQINRFIADHNIIDKVINGSRWVV